MIIFQHHFAVDINETGLRYVKRTGTKKQTGVIPHGVQLLLHKNEFEPIPSPLHNGGDGRGIYFFNPISRNRSSKYSPAVIGA